eukprot:gene3882-9968_t
MPDGGGADGAARGGSYDELLRRKHLYTCLPFDANVNEPSLHLDLGPPGGPAAADGDYDDGAEPPRATFRGVLGAVVAGAADGAAYLSALISAWMKR